MRQFDCEHYKDCLTHAAHRNCDFICPCNKYQPTKNPPTYREVRGCLRLCLLSIFPEDLIDQLHSDPDLFAEALMRVAVPADDSVEHQVFL